MNTRKPLVAALVLLISLPFMTATTFAQNGPPAAGGPFDRAEPGVPPMGGGPPPWAGGPPPWAGPPPRDDDNGDNGDDDDDAVPDFCSAPGFGQGPGGQAGLSSIAHLNFSQIDPDTGEPVEDGAWARIMYRWIAPLFDYVINAHDVEPLTEYTLTYQPEPMPSPGVICLGTATSNPGGQMNLQDALDIATDLPADHDANEDEAQLVLVLAADVDCEAGDMIHWAPGDYLFGDEGMFYVHSDLDDNDDNGDD